MNKPWYLYPPAEVLSGFRVDVKTGLSSGEVKRRLEQFGLNQLPDIKPDSVLAIFFRQFKSPLIYILMIAGLVVFLLGEPTDSLVILFVLLFNAFIGSIQEGRAQHTLLALKRLTQTQATVLRDQRRVIIPDTELVPGDIILLHEGEKVPADGRLLEVHNLIANEAALTGESVPIHKVALTYQGQPANDNRPIGDQKNMIFKGSYITAGTGKAVVVATGVQTVIGQITQTIETIHTDMPLQGQIKRLVRIILIAVAFFSILLFFLGLGYGFTARHIFSLVVSLAVSSIPEGLPVVLTIVLATGLWRLGRRHALIKKLPAVEALGQTTVIAVDKTGTITQNELMVKLVQIGDKQFWVDGNGYAITGGVKRQDRPIHPKQQPELIRAAQIAAITASAHISRQEKGWQVTGDPTEAALLVLGIKLGFEKEKLLSQWPIVEELAFSHDRQYHAVLHRADAGYRLSVAGAPEILLEASQLTQIERDSYDGIVRDLTNQGLRVVAFAYHDSRHHVDVKNLPKLTFGGFYGMQDVLQPKVREVVEQIHRAQIKLVMITGDHKNTARSIAAAASIYRDGDQVLTGEELEKMTEAELDQRLAATTVFARVSPVDKQRIVQAYRRTGEIVAMTGDGVNDAPSLVAADMGIALGGGTEVAKEAADLVLLDDNLGSIAAAIEEGRGIYKTIKKVILYLFSTSLGEILAITGGLVAGFALPITPSQIIWLNLVTDGFLNVALALEPPEKGLLQEPPNHRKQLVDRLMVGRMLLMSSVMMLGTLFFYQNYLGDSSRHTSTLILTLLAVFQWFNAWNCRHSRHSIIQLGLWTNPYLVAATVFIVGLQLVALHTPFLQGILNTEPLSLIEWLAIILLASSILWVEEFRKLVVSYWRKDLGSLQNSVRDKMREVMGF